MHIHLLIPTARLGQGLLALAEAAGIENCNPEGFFKQWR